MADVTFRAATAEDCRTLGLQLDLRIRGVTAERDGAPIAVGGLAYLPDGTAVAFLEGAEHVPAAPIAFTKAVKRGLADARARGVRSITAAAQDDISAAPRWLERLGFVPLGFGDPPLYRWEA